MVVGRFNPYHNAHHKLVNHALSLGDKVIIVLGSSHTKPDPKNPFTAKQREEMIRSCFDETDNGRLVFAHVRDYPYNENLWITEIQNIANEILAETQIDKPKMALVGHFKDESSYYLNLFPQWKLENFEPFVHNQKVLNATDIRKEYLHMDFDVYSKGRWNVEELVPEPVFKFLREFSKTEEYKTLVREHKYVEEYIENSKFVGLPFEPTFVTTDTLVTALGHVLVVRRGHHPGKDTLALPGGFLAKGLTLEKNALKELKEETDIKVPKQILQSNIVGREVFDHPYRSLRGRTITHGFHIELNPNLEDGLPKVKGGDDAEKAFWMPLADLWTKEDEFFEDHLDICRHFLAKGF